MKYFVVAYEAQAGMFDDALVLAQTISDEYSGPKSRLTIAAFLAQAGKFDKATEVAQTIRLKRKPGADEYDPSQSYETSAWELIARAQTNAGKPADAIATLARIHDSFTELSGSSVFEKVYALSAMGKFDEAKNQLPKVDIGSFDDEKVRVFALAASAYCRRHSVAECQTWAHAGGTDLARAATLIGAAQGLSREVKQENPIPIYVH
jgi:tetratricopeptide (TPR) repeat protein